MPGDRSRILLLCPLIGAAIGVLITMFSTGQHGQTDIGLGIRLTGGGAVVGLFVGSALFKTPHIGQMVVGTVLLLTS